MKKLEYYSLLILFAATVSLAAQVVPTDLAEQSAPSEDTEDTEANPLQDNPAEEPADSETTPAEQDEIVVEEDEEWEWNQRGDSVVFGGGNRVGPRERVKDMVTMGGNAIAEGHVDGDMVTIGGNAKVMGSVDGDFVVVFGSAELGPEARLDRGAVVIGGRLTVHPDAKIDGEHVNIPLWPMGALPHFKEAPLFMSECVFLARPISPNVPFTLYAAAILLLFYLLLAAIFSKPLQSSARALEAKPLQAFLVGILAHAVGPLFVLLMVITLIGIALIPFVTLAVLALTVFGKAAVFFHIGKQIARVANIPALGNPFLSIIAGGIITYALYMIPFFGLFLWLVLSALGLGAVCLAIGNSISKRKAAGQADPPQQPGAAPTAAGSASDVPEPVQLGTSLDKVDSATAALFGTVGFWWRTLATLIDLILVSVVTSLLDIAMFPIAIFAYFILFWGWKGSSLGGMALGIRIQKISGEPLNWPAAIIRSLSSIVSLLPFFLGFFWAGWDPANQSWHDKIAGTNVVRVPKGYTWN